jgi:hypothetical protein
MYNAGVGSSFGFTIPFTVLERNVSKKLPNPLPHPVPSSLHRLSLPSFTQDPRKKGTRTVPSLSARMLPGWNSSLPGPEDRIDSDGQRFSSNTSVEGPAMTLEIGLTPSRSRVSESSLSAMDLNPAEVGVIVNGSSFAQCGSSSFTQSHCSFTSDRRGNQSDGVLVTKGGSVCSDFVTGSNASARVASIPRNLGGMSSHSMCDSRSCGTRRDISTPNSQIDTPFSEGASPSPIDKGLIFLLVDGEPRASCCCRFTSLQWPSH